MNILNSIWRLSFGKDKHVVDGQKALKNIQSLLLNTIAKYEGVSHALTSEEIAPIKAICDQLFPENFLLKVPGTNCSEIEAPACVHYQHVYENESFSIGIFILPPGVAIPLHDHPRMSVISRILYGSLHIKSYDFVNGTVSSGTSKLARRCMDKVIAAPYTTELLPDCGNLHELIGGDDIGCAFLDIITPPYDANCGRDCTYFRVQNSIDSQVDESEELVMLEKFDPQDFKVVSKAYHGPQW
ncbi:Uncharacterized conserved protein [Plasmopara halstedii]|uniref:Uncharacterized conserved protein n=1 Tax=Plasmopara halstedii TaxID=4781 RepID=A0A0P1B525_PLAHL|nr:Uncharacterized conserved protein [Plasmopara halstedii]CEG49082.1 Uncharacterized conserved protein [Plasmopara halstedii]|eukprot:XP_024585451.1 Uncharacterized conserved protein [Plasmopara halstedii]